MLPRASLVGGLGAGYRQLLADYFWIETLQAVTLAETPEQYRDIYDYAKLVTALDPKFRPVYLFAATTLPVEDDQHKWHNTAESTELLERGLAEFPDYVYLRVILAYNWTTYQHDYKRAARLLAETARMPGAPPFVGGLATRLYAQAGDFDAGLTLAKALAQSAEDDQSRQTFERRVQQLRLERILVQIDEATATFRQRNGRLPASVQELVTARLLTSVPPDPLGGELVIGADGRSRSTAEQKRLELAPGDSP